MTYTGIPGLVRGPGKLEPRTGALWAPYNSSHQVLKVAVGCHPIDSYSDQLLNSLRDSPSWGFHRSPSALTLWAQKPHLTRWKITSYWFHPPHMPISMLLSVPPPPFLPISLHFLQTTLVRSRPAHLLLPISFSLAHLWGFGLMSPFSLGHDIAEGLSVTPQSLLVASEDHVACILYHPIWPPSTRAEQWVTSQTQTDLHHRTWVSSLQICLATKSPSWSPFHSKQDDSHCSLFISLWQESWQTLCQHHSKLDEKPMRCSYSHHFADEAAELS